VTRRQRAKSRQIATVVIALPLACRYRDVVTIDDYPSGAIVEET